MRKHDASTGRRIASLDGLRAVAVSLVVIGHYFDRTIVSDAVPAKMAKQVPFLGVALFFAISGFLITRLLVLERREVGRIHLWRFYARRIVRLWPALWALVVITAILATSGVLAAHRRDFLGAAFFVMDYVPDPRSAYLFHTWSLGIEEQFYLLWPPVLIVAGIAAEKRVLIVAAAFAPIVRLASYTLVPGWRGEVVYQFHDRYDALAAGCLLAVYWESTTLQRLLHERRRPLIVSALVALVGVELIDAASSSSAFQLLVGYSVESVAFAAIVALAISAAPTRVGRALNARAAVHVGVISYSAYLWQQMFILRPFWIFTSFPVGLAALLVAAELSWRTLEHPFDRVRRRLHPPARARTVEGSAVAPSAVRPN